MNYFTVRRDSGAGSSDEWWGDDCIAAYRFKGAESEAQSRVDLTGHGYDLTRQNNPTWDAENGAYLKNGWLSNSDLNALDTVRTIVIRYSELDDTNYAFLPFSQIKGTNGYNVTKDLFVYGRFRLHYAKNGVEKWNESNFPAILSSYIPASYDWVEGAGKLSYYLGDQKLNSSGVLGASISDSRKCRMYYNGSPVTLEKVTIDNVTNLYSDNSPNVNYSYSLCSQSAGWYVQAASFYSSVLSEDRQREVCDAMRAL